MSAVAGIETRTRIARVTPELCDKLEEIWKTKPGLLGFFSRRAW